MDIELLTYSAIDGIPSLSDSEVMGLYNRIEDDGLAKAVFYDGSVNGSEEFLRTMKFGQVQLFVVLVDKVAAGIMWLTNFEVRSATLHYCFFKSHHKMDLVNIGKTCILEILNMEQDGLPLFDILTGLTPETNRAANIWNRKMKFSILGKIPNACWVDELQKSVPGTVCYVERGNYG